MTFEEVQDLFEEVYYGGFDEYNLPTPLYLYTGTALMRSVFKGFGKSFNNVAQDSKDFNKLFAYNRNISIFSGAKTFKSIRAAQKLLITEDGSRKSFSDFKADVKELNVLLNKDWLRTEQDTAIAMAQNSQQWESIEEDSEVLPYLQYVTAGDERVRDEHAELDGLVYPVNHPFWNTFMPPNGFNCRCEVIQLNEARVSKELSKSKLDEIKKGVPTLFRHNPAKVDYIFKTEGRGVHPYIKVESKYEALKNNNFGFSDLPI